MPTPLLYIHGGTTYDTYELYLENLRGKNITLERLRPSVSWQMRLQEQLGTSCDVLAPRMPNGTNAQYEEWCIYFERILPILTEKPICIGHSLGGIFLVKYLAEHTIPTPFLATLLVAAPYKDTPEESLASFSPPVSHEGFVRQAGTLHIYHSKDDPVVPFADGEMYASIFPKATFHPLDGYGHFNVPEFPEIVSDIRTLADTRAVT